MIRNIKLIHIIVGSLIILLIIWNRFLRKRLTFSFDEITLTNYRIYTENDIAVKYEETLQESPWFSDVQQNNTASVPQKSQENDPQVNEEASPDSIENE